MNNVKVNMNNSKSANNKKNIKNSKNKKTQNLNVTTKGSKNKKKASSKTKKNQANNSNKSLNGLKETNIILENKNSSQKKEIKEEIMNKNISEKKFESPNIEKDKDNNKDILIDNNDSTPNMNNTIYLREQINEKMKQIEELSLSQDMNKKTLTELLKKLNNAITTNAELLYSEIENSQDYKLEKQKRKNALHLIIEMKKKRT
jgi:hypothetical protein